MVRTICISMKSWWCSLYIRSKKK